MGLFSSHANKIGKAHGSIKRTSDARAPKPSTPLLKKTCPRVTEKKAALIVEGYTAGKTVYELADEYRINRVTVSEVLKRQGVKLRRQPPTEEQIRQMARLYESGLSLKKVGDRLGFNATTVRANLLKAGVGMRDSHGRP